MYSMNIKPQDLNRAAMETKELKKKADINTVLKGVDDALAKYVRDSKTNAGLSAQVIYSNHQVSADVLREACSILTGQGFQAKVDYYEGYDDGPCSVHSSPPEYRIIISTQ